MGTMRILDETGDTMVTWSLEETETLERATKVFDAAADQGRPGLFDSTGRARSATPSASRALTPARTKSSGSARSPAAERGASARRHAPRAESPRCRSASAGRGARAGRRRSRRLSRSSPSTPTDVSRCGSPRVCSPGAASPPSATSTAPSSTSDRSRRGRRQSACWSRCSTTNSVWTGIAKRRFRLSTPYGVLELGALHNMAFWPSGLHWDRGHLKQLSLCVVPRGDFKRLPEADIWTNLLLVVRAEPERFFTVANWRGPSHTSWYRPPIAGLHLQSDPPLAAAGRCREV